MDRLKMNNYSVYNLLKLGFKYNRNLSDSVDDIYTYRFTVATYGSNSVLETVIDVSSATGVVNINVVNSGTRELYANYYNREYGYNKLLSTIDAKITKKIKEFNIVWKWLLHQNVYNVSMGLNA